MKAYLRYRFLNDFGGVCSSECNVIFDLYGTFAYTAVNEFIYKWSLKTLEFIDKLCYINKDSETLSSPAYCTFLTQHPIQNECLACGHSDGSVRLWDIPSKTITATFHGHKSAISVTLFTLDGHFLITGGRDTDIVVWDVSGLTGLFRLRGHQGGITALCLIHIPLLNTFYSKNEQTAFDKAESQENNKNKKKSVPSNTTKDHIDIAQTKAENIIELSKENSFLVSGSKDGSVRIWDLISQHCLQAVFDTSGEICSLMVDPARGYLFVGSGDSQLKLFKINYNVSNENHLSESPTRDVAVFCGTIRRKVKKHKIQKIIQFINIRQAVQTLFNPLIPLVSNELAEIPRVETDQGSLTLSSNSHVTFNNIRRLYLLISLQRHRAIEVYRQYPDSDIKIKLKKKKKKIKQLLKKKNQQLSELNRHVLAKTAFPSVLSEETNLLEAQLTTLEKELESLKLDYRDQGIENMKSQFSDSESFEHIYTFYLPKKPVSVDATFSSSPSLIFTYNDNSMAVYDVDVKSLLTKKRQYLMDPKQTENEKLFQLRHCIENYGHISCPKDIAVSHDDSTLATVAEHYLYLWHFDTLKLTRCINLHPHQLILVAFSPDPNIVIAATKDGTLICINVALGSIIQEIKSKIASRISCFTEHPKQSGYVISRSNKQLEFYQYNLHKKKKKCALLTWHEIADSATCMQYTPDGRLLIIALLDFTLQVLYSDTLKLFLTLYGHQLPCTSLTISSDSVLLVTGSHDKTMKVWNLQFGNIESSIIAHDGVITQVEFLKDTHQVVSSGMDCVIKLWDIDRRDLICQFLGHIKPILFLRLSRLDSDRIISASGDKVLRVLERTSEQLYPEEEKEKMLEIMAEKEAARSDLPIGGKDIFMIRPTRKTMESIRSTEQLMEAIELAHSSQKQLNTYRENLETWKQYNSQNLTEKKSKLDNSSSLDAPSPVCPEQPELSLLLMGLSPVHYIYTIILKLIPTSVLHEVVFALPFSFAEKLLELMYEIFRLMNEATPDSIGVYGVELLARLTLLTIHTHLNQLIASIKNQQLLLGLHRFLQTILLLEKSHLEFSQAGMSILDKKATESLQMFH